MLSRLAGWRRLPGQDKPMCGQREVPGVGTWDYSDLGETLSNFLSTVASMTSIPGSNMGSGCPDLVFQKKVGMCVHL